MSDYVYESGISRRRRRQRRTAITLLLTVLFLAGAFYWAWSYIRDGGPNAVADDEAQPTVTSTACADADDAKSVTINVYNSTRVPGLARSAADDLEAAGFTIGQVANDPEGIGSPWPLVVRFGPEGQAFAESFRDDYVPVGLANPRDRTGTDLDLILGQGFEELPPIPVLPPCESE